MEKPVREARKLGYNRFISHPLCHQDMMAVAMRVREFGSTDLHPTFEPAPKLASPDRFEAEKAFSSILIDVVCGAVADALGRYVLDILSSKGLLDNSNDAKEFDRKLQLLFGNGAAVLERLVVKDLYRKLSIPYDSDASFDYGKSLEVAKETCFVESRHN